MKQTKIVLTQGNFAEYEKQKLEACQKAFEKEIEEDLNALMRSTFFLLQIKRFAAERAYRFAGMVELEVRLITGGIVKVLSPKFVKAKPKGKTKRGRKKKRNPGATRHFALELLGFENKNSPNLTFLIAQNALVSPSFEIASQLLKSHGIDCSSDFIRKTTYRLSDILMTNRTTISLDGAEKQPGLKLLICIDGGRLRVRENKRGRIKTGKKRPGFHANWKEPHLFTISTYNKNGELEQLLAPLYDATMSDLDGSFELLYQYLTQFNLEQAEEITFCADNGNGIWKRIQELAKRLKLKKHYEVLDYTHAKQNFNDVLQLLWHSRDITEKNYSRVVTELKNKLWEGDIKGIREKVEALLYRTKVKKKALKKIDNYFEATYRFQYSKFAELGLPNGSGVVESAIRRVINLRIKGPGIFWKKQNSEKMLFLRSAFLSGRWETLQKNYLKNATKEFNTKDLEEEGAA